MLNTAIVGPPGSGKGTQARDLCDRFDLVLISTGGLFRRALDDGTALGMLARSYMERNELVPDELVDAMIEEKIGSLAPDQGALFDGFPRTAYQAKFLDDQLASLGRTLDVVVHLEVPDDDVVERLAGRLACRQCDATYHDRSRPPAEAGRCDRCGGDLFRRPDDEAATARARLRTFHRNVEPVLAHYEKDGRLAVADGGAPRTKLSAELVKLFGLIERGERRPAPIAHAPEVAEAGTVMPTRHTAALVLLGGPGSGKGTQAFHIAGALGVPHVSTGDLFRENLKAETSLGQMAKAYMDRGELVPDEVTEEMVRNRLGLQDATEGFVLDGYPRSRDQAEALDDMLAGMGRRLAGAVSIRVSDEEIVRRLSGRLTCRSCQTSFHTELKAPKADGVCDNCGGELFQRDDDSPETIKARLRTFHGNDQRLVEYYEGKGLLHYLEGEGPPDEVRDRVLETAAFLAKGS